MLHQIERAVNQRAPIHTYHPENAPHVTACVTYRDPDLGIVARSVRSSLGIMRASTAIHFDAGVFDQLIADGCQWLEVFIKDSGTTYRCSVEVMHQHGQLQQRFGLQRVLSLKYWQVDKPKRQVRRRAKSSTELQLTDEELSWFE